MASPDRPKVGIAAIIRKENKVLLGFRSGAHGKGTWGFAGGHLELGESFEDCVQREVEEEVGIKVANLQFGTLTNSVFSPTTHYVTIFIVCDYHEGELTNLEPDKTEKWEWFGWDELPEPLFLPIIHLKETPFNPFEL